MTANEERDYWQGALRVHSGQRELRERLGDDPEFVERSSRRRPVCVCGLGLVVDKEHGRYCVVCKVKHYRAGQIARRSERLQLEDVPAGELAIA